MASAAQSGYFGSAVKNRIFEHGVPFYTRSKPYQALRGCSLEVEVARLGRVAGRQVAGVLGELNAACIGPRSLL